MSARTLKMPQMRMKSVEEEEFGVVPLLETPPAARRGPMLQDCFFGTGAHVPSPLLKRRSSSEVTTEEYSPRGGSQPSYAQYSPPLFLEPWSFIGENVQPTATNVNGRGQESPSDCGSQWTELANVGVSGLGGEGWLEEWMDMNGIFDPSVELSCNDVDISACRALDQVIPELNVEVITHPVCSPHTAVRNCLQEQQKRYSDSRNEFRQTQDWNSNRVRAGDGSPGREWSRDSTPEYATDTKNFRGLRSVSKKPEEMCNQTTDPLPGRRQPLRSAKVISVSAEVGFCDGSAVDFRMGVRPKSRTSPYITDKKREQNRSAAIRYRDKRREEAKRKKEELHEQELRNVALKTELAGLNTEIAYLKELLHEVIGS